MALGFKYKPENTYPLFGKLIVLDPGHGGADPGAIYNISYEKDYNLKFAFSLKNVLERYGASVILTREGDYDLSTPNARHRKKSDFNNRIKLINSSDADMYLSLHMNNITSQKYYGAQCFYSNVNPNNIDIANIMQNNFNLYFKYEKDISKIGTNLYMFSKIDIRGILIEYGFMSSEIDRVNLSNKQYRDELSEVIALSVIEYFT